MSGTIEVQFRFKIAKRNGQATPGLKIYPSSVHSSQAIAAGHAKLKSIVDKIPPFEGRKIISEFLTEDTAKYYEHLTQQDVLEYIECICALKVHWSETGKYLYIYPWRDLPVVPEAFTEIPELITIIGRYLPNFEKSMTMRSTRGFRDFPDIPYLNLPTDHCKKLLLDDLGLKYEDSPDDSKIKLLGFSKGVALGDPVTLPLPELTHIRPLYANAISGDNASLSGNSTAGVTRHQCRRDTSPNTSGREGCRY